MAKKNRGGRRRGGNGKKNWSNAPNPYQIPEKLEDALGERGGEMSMADAALDANPYYSASYSEFSENCQRCVMAYEMRRRGYDVEALPTYEGDIAPYGATGWQRALDGMTTADVGRTTERATINNIERQMKDWGEGSRAILRIKWAGGNSGHVINVEYQNGKLYAYDAQDKSSKTGRALLEDYMPYTTLSHTQLFRTDNTTPTDYMKEMVRPSENKVPKERRKQTSLIAG